MRDIVFRGKIADNYYIESMRGTWAEGNLVHQTEYYGMKVDRYHILYTGEFDVDYYDSAVVITETIGQFTGRYDKNGKKIFEGDIVRRCRNAFDFEPRETWVFEIGHIEYNMGGFVVPELSSVTHANYNR